MQEPTERGGPADFRAPLWLRSPHVQTLGASLPLWATPRSSSRAPSHVRIPLPGGGSLHGRADLRVEGAPATAVVLVHGLGGHSESRYVARAALGLRRAGHPVVRLDLRGIGEGVHDAPALYHAGLTEDPRVAAEWTAKQPGVSGVVLVGFSMGGHVLLRLAGELGGSPGPVRGIVAISAPVDLHAVSRAIERFRSLPYASYVLRHLVHNARVFARLHPERAPYDPRHLGRLKRIRAYDDVVTAPMHGYADAADYYRRASAAPLLARIEVPTLVLHAEDDPMVPPSCVRPWLDSAPRIVERVWSARGGHVGWFGGLSERDWVDTWAVRRTREFVARVGS